MPHSISIRRSLAIATLAAAGALACLAGSAAAYVTPQQAEDSALRGAQWFQAGQQEDGALAGDWGMTALAAAEINAADVTPGIASPSAQDYYAGFWEATGPGGAATDAERAILAGVAGGIQPARLAPGRNLVATVVGLFDGTQIGNAGLLNDDIFGVLALEHVDAPAVLVKRVAAHVASRQLDDGGWSWSAGASGADTDVTAAALAALCAGGTATDDPRIEAALDLLRDRQDPATGGFAAPPWMPVNTNSTAWVASGLIQCGIDPQAAAWTTPQGKTPLDFLVSMQRADGHFDWSEDQAGSTSFATWDAVRPLGGAAFSSAPPERLDPSAPAIRPAPEVAEGTTAQIAVVVDHGPGADPPDRVRSCSVSSPVGADLDELLESAAESSSPSGCVAEYRTEPGIEGAVLSSLNGVAAQGESAWRVRVDDSTPQIDITNRIGLGDLVFLRFASEDDDPVDPPPVDPPPAGPADRVKVRIGARLALVRGKAAVRVRCPAGSGRRGCVGTIRLKHRGSPAARRAAYRVRSGTARRVKLRAKPRLRRAVRSRRAVRVRVVAATRSESGIVAVSRARRAVRR